METVTVGNKEIEAFRIENDNNGNPRYVVHFTDLGVSLWDYDNINKLYGFKKYTAKWFGGGVVFQSYNIEETIKWALETVKKIEAVK
ncbi:hypothetical protein SEP9_100 [Staphylococcus phage vB_SepS_SEP9]|uniref:TreK n=1 Tax=Staphylococcus phage vB_SepS_SEP9 TaxID=1434319 RepID=W5RV27_9CAUD|nr:hypothetical protein SEP9_100 [Staphylococcus phage vB_SepS_SEP9]AHG24021.1 hypothetical protein SEP9_100 [Staphylococcus phage vB_SepS_SEP9]